MSRKSRLNSIDGPFIHFTRDLLESDAWRSAPINTRRLIDRICLEHLSHAGKENGNLPCTYDDFVRWGIDRKYVYGSIKDAIKRGLIYQSQQGIASPGAGRSPNIFGLGWIRGRDGSAAPNNWKGYIPEGVQRNIYSSSQRPTILNGLSEPNKKSEGVNIVDKEVLETGEYSRQLSTEKIISQAQQLPPDWRIRRAVDGHVRIHNANGVALPRVDHPLVGTPEEQAALTEYKSWSLDLALKRLTRKEREEK